MKPVVALIGILGGVALGFVAGRQVAPTSATDRASAIPHLQDVANVTREDVASPLPAAITAATAPARERVRQLIAIRSRARRVYELETYLAGLAIADLPAVLTALKDIPGRSDRIQFTNLLFARWGELDGPAAVAATANLPRQDRWIAEAGAYDGWAKINPRSAWEAAREAAIANPTAGFRGGGALRELARIDLAGAIGEVGKLPAMAAGLIGRHTIIEAAAEEGNLAVVMQAALQLSPSADREGWMKDIFTQWGSLDTSAPLDALRELDDPQLARSAMLGLLTGWAQSDPRGAVEFALDHQDDPLVQDPRNYTLSAAAQQLDASEIRDIMNRARANGSFQNVAPQLLGYVAYRHPALALELAGEVADARERTRIVNSTFSSWGSMDYPAAAAQFEQLPATPDRTAAFGALSGVALQQTDGPATVSRWISSFTGTERVAAARNVVEVLEQRQRQPTARPLPPGTTDTLARAITATPDLPADVLTRMRALLPAPASP